MHSLVQYLFPVGRDIVVKWRRRMWKNGASVFVVVCWKRKQ